MNSKKFKFIVITAIPIIFLTGCWNSRELNTLAITICTGVDKSKDGYIVTQQILNPKAISSKGASSEAPVTNYAAQGKDLFECFRKITAECPRKVYTSQLRMLVLGEKAAKKGIGDVVDFLSRDHELRTDFYFVIAKGTTAKKALNILTSLDSVPGIKMYNSLKTSENLWASTKSTGIIELTNSILSDGRSPVITELDLTKGAINSNSTDALKTTNSIKKLKYSGLAVFRKDKLVGWLNEIESKGYNYICGNVKSTEAYVNYGKKVTVVFEVIKADSKIKASIIKNKPVINVNVQLSQNIVSIDGSFDISKEQNIKILNKLGEQKLKLVCYTAVKKAQRLRSDIFGFGEAVHRASPKIWKHLKSNWNNEFSHINVHISTKINTIQSGALNQALLMKEK